MAEGYPLLILFMNYILHGEVDLTKGEKELVEEYVNSIDRFDEDSTFFRYPIDKKGNRNKKAMTEEIDEELLNLRPCCLGAFVCAKGSENFACLHREQFMKDLEFDLGDLIKLLIRFFDNEKND